jgi:tetratricopeptide (TPR) repeat protein
VVKYLQIKGIVMSSPVSFKFLDLHPGKVALSRSGKHVKIKKGSQEITQSLEKLMQELPIPVTNEKENHVNTLKDRAHTLEKLGLINELMGCLTQIAEQSPTDECLYPFIFSLYAKEATHHLQTLAHLNVPLAIYHLGLLVEKTDFVAALVIFGKMGKKDPYALKLLNAHAKNYNEAIKKIFETRRFDDLLKLSDSNIPTANFYIGLHYEQNHAPEKAKEQYLKIKKVIPYAMNALKERALVSPLAAEALCLLLSADHA